MRASLAGLVSASCLALAAGTPALAHEARLALARWAIQSSAKVAAKGDLLSRPGFDTEGWEPARVPNTVLAVQVENGRFPDPYFGMNLRAIPGTDYPIGQRLNSIRLEGKLEGDLFYDLADEMGIRVMPGWCCCDQWERWDEWDAEDYRVAPLSLHDQILRLRNHPSVLAWFNGSDFHPPANVEKSCLEVEQKPSFPKPVVSSETDKASEVSGPSGMKMLGPYDYVPPSYWLTDTRKATRR